MEAKGHRKETQHNTAPIEVRIQHLIDKFEACDRDHDGGLSICEFRDLLRNSGFPMSDKLLVCFFGDVDGTWRQGDKNVTMAEIKSFEFKVKKTRELFHALDEDGSGLLDRKELRVLLKELGLDDEDSVKQIIKEADASGDGKISYEEFMYACFPY